MSPRNGEKIDNGSKRLASAVFIIGIIAAFFATACAPVAFHKPKPPIKRQCDQDKCVPQPGDTFSWERGNWNTCSRACGGGDQTRDVHCERQDGVTVPDALCKGDKPVSSRSCNVEACSEIFNWNRGDWSGCSVTCGGGEETRDVICQDQSGNSVADNLCSQPKPNETRACGQEACPPVETYNWDADPQWGTCSVACGGGTQTRQVVCRSSNGQVVADALCDPNTRPISQQNCNTDACQPNYTYAWIPGAWGECSKTCGGGQQTRSVMCQRNDGQFVADNLCDPNSRPTSVNACNPQACPPQTRHVSETHFVAPAQTQVDILVVVDDSASMTPENKRLAQRMGGFLASLNTSNIDWRMCITTTDVDYYNGKPIEWVGAGSHIMTRGTANPQSVFDATIDKIGSGWGNDEQGIKAMNLSVMNDSGYGCYRPEAALSVILISDENERSTGGNYDWSSAQYKPLEALNYPSSFVQTVANKFNHPGYIKPLTVNSIIVKPGDVTCETEQDAQGVPSFFGTLYNELSANTGGYVGSICDTDYYSNLRHIKERTHNSLASIQLQCAPVGPPSISVPGVNATLQGNQLRFDPVLPEGTQVTVEYDCPL